jgi:hypothetical protein
MSPDRPVSGSVELARFYWMMLGPLILALLTIANVNGKGWFGMADVAFLVMLAGLVVARWYEFRRGDPTTSTGEPATPNDLRRYVIGVIVIGLGLWVLANLAGNYWLAG